MKTIAKMINQKLGILTKPSPQRSQLNNSSHNSLEDNRFIRILHRGLKETEHNMQPKPIYSPYPPFTTIRQKKDSKL